MAALEVSRLEKRFGAIVVANGISFDVQAGEIVGVIGPNGAGKTSLFNLIAGEIRPDAGAIRLEGRDLGRLGVADRRRAGLARTFQTPQPFAELSVFENALVGSTFSGAGNGRDRFERAHDALRRAGLDKRAADPAGALTLLELKRLELARALAGEPKVLLLDEIAGGLTEREAGVIAAAVRTIASEGVAVVWIEHVLHALLAVADRAFAVNFGDKLAEGAPADVLADPEVRRIYMGMGVE